MLTILARPAALFRLSRPHCPTVLKRRMTGITTHLNNRYELDDIPDQSGKTALVTGGSSGIGLYISLLLALKQANVILLSSQEDSAQAASLKIADALKEHGVKGTFSTKVADLGSLREVEKIADELVKEDRLDMLICNAGVGVAPWGLTQDKIGNHFQVNNLSHFYLINRLRPLIEKTAEKAPKGTVRVIQQSSELHRTAPSDTKFASLDEVNQERDPNILYSRSKLAGIYLTKELVKRKLASNPNQIVSIAVHPGAVSTGQQKGMTEKGAYGVFGKILEPVVRALAKNPSEGAECALWAATSDKIAASPSDFQGNYYTEPDGKPGTETDQAKDAQLAQNLWELCDHAVEQILGKKVT